MAGRRPKLTEEVINKVCAAREIGATYEICALYAGVSESTLFSWLKDAREIQAQISDKPRKLTKLERLKLEFLERVRASDAAAALTWLQVVDNAANTDPNWARWMLSVRYREYNPVSRQDITSGGETIRFVNVGVDLDRL